MLTIQPLATVGTDLRVEATSFPKVPACTRCDNPLAESTEIGVPFRSGVHATTATALVIRRASRTNRKVARTISTLCVGCARHEGFLA